MPASRAEALTAGDTVPAGNGDRLRRRKGRVRDDAVWRVDPNQARDVTRHARRIGREDRALIDDPTGAGVGFADLLEHLDVGRQIDLYATEGARKRQLEQAGVGQRLEERSRQFPVGLDLIGAGSDHGDQLSCGVERRSSLGGGHSFVSFEHISLSKKLLYSSPKSLSISTLGRVEVDITAKFGFCLCKIDASRQSVTAGSCARASRGTYHTQRAMWA